MDSSEAFSVEDWDNLPLGTLFTWMNNGDVWLNAGKPSFVPKTISSVAFRAGYDAPSARILVLVDSPHERDRVIICGFQAGCLFPWKEGA